MGPELIYEVIKYSISQFYGNAALPGRTSLLRAKLRVGVYQFSVLVSSVLFYSGYSQKQDKFKVVNSSVFYKSNFT